MRALLTRAAGRPRRTAIVILALILGASGGVGAVVAQAVANTSVSWQLQSSVNITVPDVSVQAVSCLPVGPCTEVGSYLNSAGQIVPLARLWNGTSSFRQEIITSPAGFSSQAGPSLDGVSCVSVTFCAAVGTTTHSGSPNGDTIFAEQWSGSSWTEQPIPAPAGAASVSLSAVSCTSASFCEAVGGYDESGQLLSFAEQWNGTAWTLQTTPDDGTLPTELRGVSCVSAIFCQAVDFYDAYVESWDGTTWTASHLPLPPGAANPDLSGVSCVAASYCEAVGEYTYTNSSGTSSFALLAERWDGSAWHAQSVPVQGNSSQSLKAVACVSRTYCVAVGSKEVFVSGADTFNAIAASWDGTSWHTMSVPSAQGQSVTELTAVACSIAQSCLAVTSSPVVSEAWNGVRWSELFGPAPPGAISNTLAGVSCASATFCEAVGSVTGIPASLQERWNGSAWQVQPRLASLPSLAAVSCPSATFCEAVGGTGAAAAWNGSAWQPQPAAGYYTSVSCTSATFCMAVGRLGAAQWNGTSWVPTALPALPGSEHYGEVSCASASFCEAVGPSAAVNATAGAAAAWNGSSWVAQAIPAPAGSARLEMRGVSCASTGTCEAVGEYLSASGTAGGFSAGWDGAAWTAQGGLPLPAGAAVILVSGLSCRSASDCTAVGYQRGTNVANETPLAEAWDGTSWTVEPTPGAGALTSVSCVQGGPCVATGSGTDAGGFSQAFIGATG